MKCLKRTIVVDQPRAWSVVFAGFIAYMLSIGFRRCSGILLIACKEEFEFADDILFLSVGLMGFTHECLAPLTEILCRVLTSRLVTMMGAVILVLSSLILSFYVTNVTMIIFFGCCMGLGFGWLSFPTYKMTILCFQRRTATASGMHLCGASIGALVLPPFMTFLISIYSFRGAFLILSSIFLHALVGFLFLPSRIQDSESGDIIYMEGNSSLRKQMEKIRKMTTALKEKMSLNRNESSTSEKSDLAKYDDDHDDEIEETSTYHRIFQTIVIIIVCALGFILTIQRQILYPFISREYGMDPFTIAWTLSISAGCDLVTRICSGFLLDRMPSWLTITIHGISLILDGTFIIAYSVLPSGLWSAIIYCIGTGMTNALIHVLNGLMFKTVVGSKKFPVYFPAVLTVCGISSPIVSYAVGLFYLKVGSYVWVFRIFGMVGVLCGLIYIFYVLPTTRRKERKLLDRRNRLEDDDIEKSVALVTDKASNM